MYGAPKSPGTWALPVGLTQDATVAHQSPYSSHTGWLWTFWLQPRHCEAYKYALRNYWLDVETPAKEIPCMLWNGSNRQKAEQNNHQMENLPVLRMGALLWSHSFGTRRHMFLRDSAEVWIRQAGITEGKQQILASAIKAARGDLDFHHKAEFIVFFPFLLSYSPEPQALKIPASWEPHNWTPQRLLRGEPATSWLFYPLISIERIPRPLVCLVRTEFISSSQQSPPRFSCSLTDRAKELGRESSQSLWIGRKDMISSPLPDSVSPATFLFCFRWTWFNLPFI